MSAAAATRRQGQQAHAHQRPGLGLRHGRKVDDTHGVEVEATAARGRVRVIDGVRAAGRGGEVVELLATTDDVDDAHEAHVVHVQARGAGQRVQVERRAETLAVLAGQAVDVGRVDVAEATHGCGRERVTGEAEEVDAVGRDLDESQLQEGVAETVFEHREVGASAVVDRATKGQGDAASVTQHDDVGGGALGLAQSLLWRLPLRVDVGARQVVLPAGGPLHEGRAVLADGGGAGFAGSRGKRARRMGLSHAGQGQGGRTGRD